MLTCSIRWCTAGLVGLEGQQLSSGHLPGPFCLHIVCLLLTLPVSSSPPSGMHPGPSSSSCEAGKYATAGSTDCTDCGAGKFVGQPVDGIGGGAESDCTACEAGTASSAGSPNCTSCSVGTSSGVEAATCVDCSAGFYAGVGAASCPSCAAGQAAATKTETCTVCLGMLSTSTQ